MRGDVRVWLLEFATMCSERMHAYPIQRLVFFKRAGAELRGCVQQIFVFRIGMNVLGSVKLPNEINVRLERNGCTDYLHY